MITIHTDGSSLGNPGPGGYGVVLKFKEYRKELSGGYRMTTNNRMELLSVIKALEIIKKPGKYQIDLYSDSKYITDAFNKGWVFKWEKDQWLNRKNSDLWIILLDEYRKHKINFHWVKGHANNIENERCDILAKNAAKQKNLLIDEGYEIKELF